jgi:uncharacterized protein YndB with AHSA1/START domain
MPKASVSRTIQAPTTDVWELISDPHHLPRWWPRVSRVENVQAGAFTEVLKTPRGNIVRADFDLIDADESAWRLRWGQRIAGTPFARLLRASETEMRLEPSPPSNAAPETVVTIELDQSTRGIFPRFGGHMIRRAAAATLEEALDGLERIVG